MKEKAKRKRLEYVCQLQDKMLAEDTTLLKDAEEFQVTGSKYKEITSRNEEEQWPPKKAKGKQSGKYYGVPPLR